jgi:hypothetical protein
MSMTLSTTQLSTPTAGQFQHHVFHVCHKRYIQTFRDLEPFYLPYAGLYSPEKTGGKIGKYYRYPAVRRRAWSPTMLHLFLSLSVL